MRWWWVLTAVYVSSAFAFAGVGQWKTYTAKREVRELTITRDRAEIWVATSGGLFSYRWTDGAYTEFATSEGLKTIDLTAVVIDQRGAVWIGASNGFIHLYDPSTQRWAYVADIFLLNNPQKRINSLQVEGDTLFVLSDVGVSLFSISRMEFGDTYSRFGPGPSQLVGNVTSLQIFDGQLWVSTRNGIASTPISNPNPSAPESWQVYTTTQNLPSNFVTRLVSYGDILFAATRAGLAMYDDTAWTTVVGTIGLDIVDIVAARPPNPDDPALHFITSTELWAYGGNNPLYRIANGFPSNLTSLASQSILGTESVGVLIEREGGWDRIVPPGPPSNKFIGLAIDEKGILWSATGNANGDGFMSFDGKMWKSYTVAEDPQLGNNNYYKVSIGRNNAKWVSNWGNGVALVDDQSIVRKVLNTTNGLPASIDPPFIVAGGVATDQDGVAWITNRTAPAETSLVKFNPDSSLSYVVGLQMRNPSNVFTDIVIDYNATKWFANFSRFESERAIGFFYYNERITLPGTTNGWGKLTTADGLTSDQVWSLAVDRDGDLWIGSDQGITIIFDPGNPRARMVAYHPLRDQIIQAILVDPLNNKWISTKQGVFVLSSDGTSILDRYTVENTDGKLLDNDVASLALNVNAGTIYFGTEKGLSSLSTSAVTPKRSFEELTFSPNPFYLPSTTQLTVDGLVQNSTLKILTIDGKLVREIRTPGGRIGFWDGLDKRGELVGTAVYLVIAYSEDGNKVAAGKVAVVRR